MRNGEARSCRFVEALPSACAVDLGSAPASGAVGRALAAHCVHQIRSLFGALVHVEVRREGAPNSSRGGCAPH